MVNQYYDVWQKVENDKVIPLAVEVQAESPELACQIIAQEKGISVERLQAFLSDLYDWNRE